MLPIPKDEREKQIEKLKKQVEQYERKGYKDTAAHVMLDRLLNPPEAVSPRNAKKAKAEGLKELDDAE